MLGSRVKALLPVGTLQFRDLNGNGRLEPYEDWRLPALRRVDDLVGRMTRDEKAGLMLIDTLNGSCGGAVPPLGFDLVNRQHMHRFIFRNVVDKQPACAPDMGMRAGSRLTPREAASFTNSMQAVAEGTRLGIPLLFKSNARNHVERDPRTGINNASGAMTEFPKEAGLAAAALGGAGADGAPDLGVLRGFGSVVGTEWRSIGLRGMYGYMADLSTEPRWYRVHETFTEDAELASGIMRSLVESLQGGPLHPQSPVALTMKHFPGGGPQQLGLDPHYSFGKNQVYPAGRFGEHMKPFVAAIDAGVASIMPYYGVPVGVTHDGVRYDETGMAFSRQIVTGLLRGRLGFQGYVNSDTGIVTERAWGLEHRPVPERVAAAINGGTDVLSGFQDVAIITDLVRSGLVSESRLTEAARRLLLPMFQLGLFENPYVDATAADSQVGAVAHQRQALEVQRRSIVLLQNANLPATPAAVPVLPVATAQRVYTLGIDASVARRYFNAHRAGELDGSGAPLPRDARGSLQGRTSAAGYDRAILRVEVSNTGTGQYRSKDPDSGANPNRLNPLTGQSWGAQDPCVIAPAINPRCVDDGHLGGPSPAGLVFGGALPWEADNLSFTAMAASRSWQISPSLDDIRAVMAEVGAERTVLAVYFRQPFVLDEASGLRKAGALLATFGVGDVALLDVVRGRALDSGEAVQPRGRLPFALAGNQQAIIDNAPDAPGYPAADTLFPYGHGLGYAAAP